MVGDGADSHGLCVVEGGGPSDGCSLHVFDGDVVFFEEVEFVIEGIEGVPGRDGCVGEIDEGWRMELFWAMGVVGELWEGDPAVVVVGFFDEEGLPDGCGLGAAARGAGDEDELWVEVVDEELGREGGGGGADKVGVGAWVESIGDEGERLISV